MAAPKYSEKQIARVITIALDADDNATHAFQTTRVQVFKDGEAFGAPHDSDQENINPQALGEVIPHAALLRQVADMKAAAEKANVLAKIRFADDDAQIAALKDQVQAVEAAKAALASRIDTLNAHLAAMGEAANIQATAS